MKPRRRTGDMAPLILNLGTRLRWAVNITLRPIYPSEKNSTLPSECEAGWVSESEWNFRRRDAPLASAEIRILYRPARSRAAIPTELSRLLVNCKTHGKSVTNTKCVRGSARLRCQHFEFSVYILRRTLHVNRSVGKLHEMSVVLSDFKQTGTCPHKIIQCQIQ